MAKRIYLAESALRAAVLLFVLSGGPVASAQHVLVAAERDGPRVVRKLRFDRPQVQDEGKMRATTALRFGLQPARLYGPGYVSLNTLNVRTHYLESVDTGNRLNHEIEVYCRLKADIDLKDCFLVLDIVSGKRKGLLFVEVPNLEAGREVMVERRLALDFPLDGGQLKAHVFSEGVERLHSQMPRDHIAEHEIRTEKFLLREHPDRPARPVRAVRPEYPAELKTQNLAGTARIRCRIDEKGNVVEAEVASASHPAFGVAAAAAVRQWKFDPAIKDHRYVACTVMVPFDFKSFDEAGK